MNILEAEDMVKGLPDQVLFQYAQNPPPQIPQYLAVSEVQRRQDMRQRFQAQSQGQQPTVMDQILQGGSPEQAPPGGPPGGAPPGAAPPGAPMEQPMTGAPMAQMYGGGRVPGMSYMQGGGSINAGEQAEVIREANSGKARMADVLRRNLTTPEGIGRLAAGALGTAVAGPLAGYAASSGFERLFPMRQSSLQSAAQRSVQASNPFNMYGQSLAQAGAANQSQMDQAAAMGFGDARQAYLDRISSPLRGGVVRDERLGDASLNAGSGMANGGLTPGGIFYMQEGRTVPSINLSERGITSLLQQYMTPAEISPEEKAYRELIARQAQQGLPAVIDYSPLIKQSEAAQKEALDAARSQGISAALMQLGAGLTAGDIAGGQQRAAEAVSGIMSRGRQEAAAERQYGRQLQMQGAEAQRQSQIAQMNFFRENAKALADIQSGSRKEAESKLGTALNVVTSFTNSSLDRANQAKIQGDRAFADAERQKQISRDAFLDTVREGFRSFSPKPLEGRDALKPDLVNKYNQDLKRAITLAYRSVPYTAFYMTRDEVDKVLKEALAQIDEAATPVPSEPNQGSGGRPPIGEFDRPQG